MPDRMSSDVAVRPEVDVTVARISPPPPHGTTIVSLYKRTTAYQLSWLLSVRSCS